MYAIFVERKLDICALGEMTDLGIDSNLHRKKRYKREYEVSCNYSSHYQYVHIYTSTTSTSEISHPNLSILSILPPYTPATCSFSASLSLSTIVLKLVLSSGGTGNPP